MSGPVLPLTILAYLCQLHTARADRSRLSALLPQWRTQLETAAAPELTARQWRRWRLLHAYWAASGEALIAHGRRRGLIGADCGAGLAALGPLLTPPAAPVLKHPSAGPCTALFISNLPWGEQVGECQPLELRQVKSLDRFPPLHLSARVADAAILSAGNLALEALSQWLGRKLALAEDYPLWAEAAFPDHVRLVDESASLAFVAGVMQHLFALTPATGGFSGIVRRDSGKIEPVQGFDSAYGKLEAAFDAGVDLLYLPQGTPLAALPQAGILLQQQGPRQYRYSFSDEPGDAMTIHLLADLEELFSTAFATLAPEAMAARLTGLSQGLARGLAMSPMPALLHWQACARRLSACLPAPLQPALARLDRGYRQAAELAAAGLSADWSLVAAALRSFVTQACCLCAGVLASLALQSGAWPARRALLEALQALPHPLPLSAWCELLAGPLSEAAETLLPELAGPLASLLGFARSLDLEAGSQLASPESLWNQIRFLIASEALPALFAALRLGKPVTRHELPLEAAGAFAARAADAEALVPAVLLTGAGWELPLIQADAAGFWCFAGMDARQHPVYAELAQGLQQSLPGACPYLPARLLELQRRFEPARPDLRYGLEPIRVELRLRNLSYLPLLGITCQERLPEGLSLVAGESAWQGELEPLQEVSFSYSLQPGAPGQYRLPPPATRYRLPPPYEAAGPEHAPEAGPESLLEIVADGRPELLLTRVAPARALTRQRLQIALRLENHSSLPVQDLVWPQNLLPAGLRLLRQDPLPTALAAFESLSLSFEAEARAPGELEWPALSLAYRGPDRELYQVSLAAEPLQVQFGRELPASLRRAELAWLEACAADAGLQGVHLWGEAGLGKRELLAAWQAGPALSLELQGDAFLDLPLLGARSLVRQLLAAQRRSPRELPGLSAGLELLAGFAAGSLAGDPEQDRQLKARCFQACLQLIDALSLNGPLLLRLDRPEQLDAASFELLRFLLLNQARLLLAISSREAALPAALADLPIASRRLARLDAAAVQAALDALFAPHQLPATLAQALQTRTQGLPLYLQEYLAWLVETEHLYLKADQDLWCLRGEPDALPLPERLEHLLLRDFDQVFGPGEQALLAAASVLAPSFTTQELEALVPGAAAASLISRGLAAGLFRSEGGAAAFAHPLAQALIYRRAAEQGADLSQLHAAAARRLEQQAAAPELIAGHWLRAGTADQAGARALDYCLRLGEQALRQGSLIATADWLRQAEALIASGRAAADARFYRLRGELGRHTEERPKAIEAFQHSLRLAAAPADQIRALLGLGALAHQSEALHYLQQARDLALALEDPALRAELSCQAELQLGSHFAASGAAESQAHFAAALAACAPESLARAEVLETMGYEAIKAGQTRAAEARLLEAKLLYERLQQLQGLASVYNRLGACCFYEQELARASHYFGESRRYCEQTGDRLRLAQVSHNLGLLAEARRDYAEAEAIFLANEALALSLGDTRIQGFARNQLASVRLKLRRLAEARADLEAAESLLAAATDQRGRAHVQLNRALLALLEQDPQPARRWLDAAEASFAELQDVMGLDQALLRQGHAAWLSGDLAAAGACYARCLATRQVLDHKQEDGLERVYHALGLVALAQGESETAESHLLRAEALLEQRREIPQYAIACHNLMRLYQGRGQLDLALDYKQKRDVLIGIDRYGIARALYQTEGLCPILD